MISERPQPDPIDCLLFGHLDDWVVLRWRDGPVRPPKGVPYGTHLATHLHCQHGGEIRGLNLCWLVESSPGQFYRVGEFQHGIDATWFFCYATIRKYELIAIDKDQVLALGLPDINLGNNLPADIRELRRRRDLDQYRHPGYPDDLCTGYGNELSLTIKRPLSGEQLWVRVKRVVSPTEFESELLNTPTLSEGAAGEIVTTRLLTEGATSTLISFPRNANVDSSPSGLKINDMTAAVLLYELDSAASMPRSFFGERILVELLHLSDGWYGKTASISRFAQNALPVGSVVGGPIVDGHFVISVRREGDQEFPVKVEQMVKGKMVFALMVSPRDNPKILQSANLFCPNSKCVNVCSLTYSQVDEGLNSAVASAPAGATTAKLHWKCNLCGAEMMVGRETFDALYRM
ncbi:MAG: hypothetical protein EPN74_11395 [Rhodanobacter sp.]|nr:MAG: hypothetical protein EPN74_11395 [Rhodanobacter sp.]